MPGVKTSGMKSGLAFVYLSTIACVIPRCSRKMLENVSSWVLGYPVG